MRVPVRAAFLLLALSATSAAVAADLSWDFGEGAQGWHAGLSPVGWGVADSSTATPDVPVLRAGVVQVTGRRVERYFLDGTGFVRRGVAMEEWLLSPAIHGGAASHGRLVAELHGRPGAEVRLQVQWVTRDAVRALADIARRRHALAPPDTVRSVLQAYRSGRLDRRAYETFMDGWENGSGSAYVAAVNGLHQEEADLQALFQTPEQHILLDTGVQQVEIGLRALPGWQGEVVRIGVRLAQAPAVPDVLAGHEDEPFVGVAWIVLGE